MRKPWRAAPGQRVVTKVPHTELFVAFVRDALLPVIKPGQVLVLDTLPAHKSPLVDQLIEAAGARVIRLPPYSPDLHPIEMAISKIEAVLRKLARRSVDGLFRGIGDPSNFARSLAVGKGTGAQNTGDHVLK